MDVFKPYPPGQETDPDQMIYSGGFFSPADRKLMNDIRCTNPSELARGNWSFKDRRLTEMLFRYRARNFPNTLSAGENDRWQKQRLERLTQPTDDRQLNTERFAVEIATARDLHPGDGRAQNILDQLEAWGRQLSSPI